MQKQFYDLRNEIKSFMESEGKFTPEHVDEKWLTDWTFLVDLTTSWNEFSVCLQGENQLISALFQTIITFEMKLELRQTQVMANNFMRFDVFTKHSSVNSKNTQLCFPFWERNLSIGFKIWKKKKLFFFFLNICNSIFCWHKYITREFSNAMCGVAVRCSTQKFDHVSSPDFYKPYLNRDKHSLLHNHV